MGLLLLGEKRTQDTHSEWLSSYRSRQRSKVRMFNRNNPRFSDLDLHRPSTAPPPPPLPPSPPPPPHPPPPPPAAPPPHPPLVPHHGSRSRGGEGRPGRERVGVRGACGARGGAVGGGVRKGLVWGREKPVRGRGGFPEERLGGARSRVFKKVREIKNRDGLGGQNEKAPPPPPSLLLHPHPGQTWGAGTVSATGRETVGSAGVYIPHHPRPEHSQTHPALLLQLSLLTAPYLGHFSHSCRLHCG